MDGFLLVVLDIGLYRTVRTDSIHSALARKPGARLLVLVNYSDMICFCFVVVLICFLVVLFLLFVLFFALYCFI